MIALIIGMLVSLIVTLVGTPLLIRLVHKLHYGQYIRQDGPQSHLVKRGTPTLGGVVINFAILLGWASSALYRYLRSGDVPSWSAALVLFAMLSMGLLGFIDDFAKVRKKQNEGLSVGGKFIGQFIFATIYAVLALLIPTKSGFPSAQAGISFIEQPFFNFDFAGRAVAIILFVIWVNFLMTAWTNAVNLTDGLDGLAAGSSMIAFTGFGIIAFWESYHIKGGSHGGYSYAVSDPQTCIQNGADSPSFRTGGLDRNQGGGAVLDDRTHLRAARPDDFLRRLGHPLRPAVQLAEIWVDYAHPRNSYIRRNNASSG